MILYLWIEVLEDRPVIDWLLVMIANAETYTVGAELKADVATLNQEMSDVKAEISELSSAAERAKEEERAISHRLSANRNALSRLNEAEKGMRAAEGTLKELEPLYRVAFGASDKQTFETIVQAAYFERVLRHANRRLAEMTGGRYRLEIRKEMRE